MSAMHTPGPWAVFERLPSKRLTDPVAASFIHCGKDETDDTGFSLIARAYTRDGLNEREANARLIAAAPDYHTACGGGLHPGEADSCGPLAWLKSAVEMLREKPVIDAALSGDDVDPEAYWEMVNEVEALHRSLTTALAKARGQ